MLIDTKQILSMTEVNQNFSKAAKVATENGSALVMKNNKPRYMIIDINAEGYLSDDAKIEIAAKQILDKYRSAFEELAR